MLLSYCKQEKLGVVHFSKYLLIYGSWSLVTPLMGDTDNNEVFNTLNSCAEEETAWFGEELTPTLFNRLAKALAQNKQLKESRLDVEDEETRLAKVP